MSLQPHGEHLKLKRHISKAVSFPGASKCRLGLTELGDQSLAQRVPTDWGKLYPAKGKQPRQSRVPMESGMQVKVFTVDESSTSRKTRGASSQSTCSCVSTQLCNCCSPSSYTYRQTGQYFRHRLPVSSCATELLIRWCWWLPAQFE